VGEKSAATKQKLLDVAMQLMMSRGYNATKVEDICQMAEVTKGAFFYYFKTKEALGVSVLQEYWQIRQRQFSESDWMSEEQPLQQIQRFLTVVAEVFINDPNGYSCLAGSFSQELATTNSVFRDLVSGLFAEWAQQIKPVLQAAKEQAPSQNTIDIDVLADYIIAVVEGSLILALARQDPQVIAQHIAMLNSHLQFVFST
jgi:TetR/AcrR family transcriptional regulator, transcriptional repressor for nem operon